MQILQNLPYIYSLFMEFKNAIMPTLCYQIGINQKPIKEIKYNSDGDLIFGCGVDDITVMINQHGNVLGTFERGGSAVNSLCPLDFTLITGSSDSILSTWDIVTGQLKTTHNTDSIVRSIDNDGEVIYFLSDNSMNIKGYIGRLDQRVGMIEKLFYPENNSVKGFFYKKYFIFGDIAGKINKYDFSQNQIVEYKQVHYSKITSVKPSFCKTFFVSSSFDSTMKIIDSDSFTVKKKFKTEEPMNTASIFPENTILVSGGGINARDVTITKGKSTFDTNFYDIITTQKIGFYNTHSGPINSIDISPDGSQIVTGGEDGKIVLINMGNDFNTAPFTKLN